jgi:hypothetical protein
MNVCGNTNNLKDSKQHDQLPENTTRPSADTLANSGSVLLRYFGDK